MEEKTRNDKTVGEKSFSKCFSNAFHEYMSSIQYERVRDLQAAETFHIFTAGWMAATEYYWGQEEKHLTEDDAKRD